MKYVPWIILILGVLLFLLGATGAARHPVPAMWFGGMMVGTAVAALLGVWLIRTFVPRS